MAQRVKKRARFETVVRREMRSQKIGYRTLARRIVGTAATARQVDNMRGHLKKWLADPPKHKPTQTNRDRVADALGIARELLADPDDEEDHQVLLAELLRITQTLRKKDARAREAGGVS